MKLPEIITAEVIEQLISGEAVEDQHLDFKREFSLDGKHKKDLLKDIASFANAEGGDILFGVTEENGKAVNAMGLTNFNTDQVKITLRDICLHQIAPPILGLTFETVPQRVPQIFYIRVRRSLVGPHMVKLEGDNRFYMRDGASNRLMTIDNIRAAFGVSRDVKRLVDEFRLRRLNEWQDHDAPLPLLEGAKVFTHVVPAASILGEAPPLDLRHEFPRIQEQLIIPARDNLRSCSGATPSFDGVWNYSTDDKGIISLAQLLRDGTVEAVDAYSFASFGSPIVSTRYERVLVEWLPRAFSLLQVIGMQPPVYVCITIAGVKGFRGYGQSGGVGREVTRENIFLLPVRFDDWTHDVTEQLRIAFDQVWQGLGLIGSPSYRSGRWASEY